MDNENYLMNQVGGSCKLINFNNGFIGKPRNLREAQIYQYQLSKLHPFIPKFKEINDDYIILEDLTQNYENPCILDLKMGTQTHADFASTSNIAKHQQRNQYSTTSKLGIRICGSLWHDPKTGHSIKKDKFYGRSLNIPDFIKELLSFFSDGSNLRIDVVSSLLRQLRNLQSTISQMDSFRFYGSSLLIIYEGGIHK